MGQGWATARRERTQDSETSVQGALWGGEGMEQQAGASPEELPFVELL